MNKRGVFIILVLSLLVITSFISAETLKVTEEHPFFVNGDYFPVRNLNVGDLLLTSSGEFAIIKEITIIEESTPVYNIEVNGQNNYFANDILVHNKDSPGGRELTKEELAQYLLKNPPEKNPPTPNSPSQTKTVDDYNTAYKKPKDMTNDEWLEHLLERQISHATKKPVEKGSARVGKQIVHSTEGFGLPGTKGAVFLEEGTEQKSVIKAFRGTVFINEVGKPSSNNLHRRVGYAGYIDNQYQKEIENLKIAHSLGLRKFLGEVEIENVDDLTKTGFYSDNQFLLATRAYRMDYVEGRWPTDAKNYINERTLEDALAKYKKLYDAGYVQGDLQYLISSSGKAEIIDWAQLESSKNIRWENVKYNVEAFFYGKPTRDYDDDFEFELRDALFGER